MFTLPSIYRFSIYGIAFALSSIHPILGFIFLFFVGISVGIYNGFEVTFMNMLKVSGVILLLTLVALIPIPGLEEIADAIILIFPFLFKMAVIRDRLVLLCTGLVLYVIPSFVPSMLSDVLSGTFFQQFNNLILFLTGASLLGIVTHFFYKAGYPYKKIAACVLGLPGFLILISLPGVNDGQ